MTVAHRLVFPLCLLVGPLLVIVAGTLHPDLAGDGAAQLAAIAQCSAWRAIHWTFLFSFPLALTGLVGLARVHAGNPGESAVRAGLIVGTFAYGAWTVTVAFMGAAGASLALSFTVADAGMTATRAVFLFDMIHPFALATQRVAGFALGLSTCLYGWGVLDGRCCRAGSPRGAWRPVRSRWRLRSCSGKTRRPTRRPSCSPCCGRWSLPPSCCGRLGCAAEAATRRVRSEEHTSELQSPFLISYAVFCLKKKKKKTTKTKITVHKTKKKKKK